MKPKHFTLAHSSLACASSGTGVVAVFRRRGSAQLEVGCFLVDRFCLGVTDAWHEVIDEAELPKMKKRLFGENLVEKDGAWGRKFVEGAVDYARQLGFKPHRDFKKAARVFDGVSGADCDETFVFGHDGKPFYIASNEESPETTKRIIRHLTARCGEEHFNCLVPLLEEDTLTERVNDLLQEAQEGRLDTAETSLKDLLEKHPDSGVVHFALGAIAALRDDHRAALPYFNEAVRLSPDMAEAWYNKGICHQKLIQFVPMTRALQKALELADPDDEFIDSARNLIGIVTKMARDDFDIDLETYLAGGAFFDRAFAKMKEGKWEEALTDLRESARINPRSHQAFGNMGTCLIQLDRIREARESLEKALKLDPTYQPAQHNLRLLEGVDENNPGKPSGLIKIVNDGRFD